MSFFRRYAEGIVRHKLLIAVVIASGLGVSFTSRDMFMTPIAAATMAGLAVVGLRRLCQSRPWSDWKHIRTAQVLSMVAVPVAFTAGLSVDSSHVFHEAFGASVPAGVRDLSIDANLLNPAGKRTVLLRFTAEPEAMADLLDAQPFQADPQMREARAANETWDAIVSQAFSGFVRFGGQEWVIPEMAAPNFRRWLRTEGSLQTETRVLWDGPTGSAFVLYTVR